MKLSPLPIDEVLPDLVRALAGAGGSVVLEAPPGAGKTTRAPRALLDAGLEGDIIVLEPRRLAARLAARRVADELGERVGETVGYTVRFEDVSSSKTRIRFVTEGVLTRRLVADPTLSGVSAVLLDEIHERHLQGDVALALLRRLQQTRRPDLRLVAMSATLDAEPIARFLERSGPGVQQVAYTVDDVDAACAALRDRGVRLLYDSPRQGTAGSRINFVHPKDAGGVLVELVQPPAVRTDDPQVG